MRRSDADEQNSAGFPETALVPQSGFGKTVPAQLMGARPRVAFLSGLPESLGGDGPAFDAGKVRWGKVILAIFGSTVIAVGVLLAMSLLSG